ncbi:MAG: hypothetical protein HY540_02585 [Deltaproteobacteria bacterium]|nr:hypothetical protein [Deltaproteobacteria bacterium]
MVQTPEPPREKVFAYTLSPPKMDLHRRQPQPVETQASPSGIEIAAGLAAGALLVGGLIAMGVPPVGLAALALVAASAVLSGCQPTETKQTQEITFNPNLMPNAGPAKPWQVGEIRTMNAGTLDRPLDPISLSNVTPQKLARLRQAAELYVADSDRVDLSYEMLMSGFGARASSDTAGFCGKHPSDPVTREPLLLDGNLSVDQQRIMLPPEFFAAYTIGLLACPEKEVTSACRVFDLQEKLKLADDDAAETHQATTCCVQCALPEDFLTGWLAGMDSVYLGLQYMQRSAMTSPATLKGISAIYWLDPKITIVRGERLFSYPLQFEKTEVRRGYVGTYHIWKGGEEEMGVDDSRWRHNFSPSLWVNQAEMFRVNGSDQEKLFLGPLRIFDDQDCLWDREGSGTFNMGLCGYRVTPTYDLTALQENSSAVLQNPLLWFLNLFVDRDARDQDPPIKPGEQAILELTLRSPTQK